MKKANTGNGRGGNVSRKQAAYEYLKNKIITCAYEPGTIMNEQQLCDALGLSRTPVREALILLEQEGLVEVLPKKGFRITELNLNDINKIYEVRMLLEPYSLLHYGPKMEKARLHEFLTLLSDISPQASDPEDYYGLDDRLHAYFLQSTGNRYLITIYETIKTLNRRLRVMSGTKVKNRIEETSAEHIRIVDACLREEWEEAAEEMRKHLEASRVASLLLLIDKDKAF